MAPLYLISHHLLVCNAVSHHLISLTNPSHYNTFLCPMGTLLPQSTFPRLSLSSFWPFFTAGYFSQSQQRQTSALTSVRRLETSGYIIVFLRIYVGCRQSTCKRRALVITWPRRRWLIFHTRARSARGR